LALLSGDADLFTGNAGYNQDLGVRLSAGYPSTANQPEAWKESGGYAELQSECGPSADGPGGAGATAYTARLQWKRTD